MNMTTNKKKNNKKNASIRMFIRSKADPLSQQANAMRQTQYWK